MTSRNVSCNEMNVILDHQNGWTYRDVFIGFKMFKSSEEDDTCTVFSQEKIILKGKTPALTIRDTSPKYLFTIYKYKYKRTLDKIHYKYMRFIQRGLLVFPLWDEITPDQNLN